MSRVIYYLLVFILPIFGLRAQSFLDSIRNEFQKRGSSEAATIAETFSSSWTKLPSDQQLKIRKQTNLLIGRGIKFFPIIANLCASIGYAVEYSGNSKLSSFLKMNDKVVEYENEKDLNQYFRFTRLFFESHSLHFERDYTLFILDDKYDFEYIEEPPPLEEDPNYYQTEQEQENLDDNRPVWLATSDQPVILGPAIKFSRLTFNFITPYDSVFLKNSSGILSLRDGLFVGNHGTFSWESAGFKEDSVFYEFEAYNFNVNTPSLKSEQGKLTYLGKLDKKIEGAFEYNSHSHSTKSSATYPRFSSFSNELEIITTKPNDIKLNGGFSLKGGKSSYQSILGGVSTLEVFHEDKSKFKAQSSFFNVTDSSIISKHTNLKIYQDLDSISHPSVYINYNIGEKKLYIQKEKGSLRNASYSASYYMVDFAAKRLLWDFQTNKMSLWVDGVSSQSPMVIESVDYFNDDDYQLLRGHSFTFHPLAVVVLYAQRKKVDKFFIHDLIEETGGNANEIRQAAIFLYRKGMINYNSATGLVKVKEKAFLFYDSQKGKIDFDNLKIHSTMRTQNANGIIDFNTNEFKVNGVDRVNISDSLHVDLKPDTSGIVINKNRDIFFNGTVNAGNLEISGKEFLFKYDSFSVKLKKIDSIRFYVNETDENGNVTRVRVNNSLVGADSLIAAEAGLPYDKDIVNTLFLNLPSNRSGRELQKYYPRLDARAGAVVYFDSKEILNGVYNRSVYFAVPRFKLDSLNDSDLRLLHFDGTFVSNGIFPKFKEDLHSMKDNSLGFVHTLPDEGYRLYQTPGRGFGSLKLNKKGLRLNGKIEYLSASLESSNFTFYLDSVAGKGNVGELKAMQLGKVWFPQVSISNFALNWIPLQDKFAIKNLQEPFSLCNNTSKFEGTLIVGKKGMLASGKIILRESEIKSKKFNFIKNEIVGNHSSFKLNTSNSNNPALSGTDVRVTHKLNQKVVTIAPEVAGEASIEFPAAKFRTSIPQAVWDLESQKIIMSKRKDFPLEKSYFYSTREDLDSLVFNAEKGEYDIQRKELKVSGIPYIIVGDARITPENNEVLILENSKLGLLRNTTIVLDTLNGYHTLTKGEIDIISRKSFSGFATYQYVNAVNDTFSIKMSNFRVEPITNSNAISNRKSELMQTVATGKIEEKSEVFIAPHILYKGDLIMYATLPALQLNGFIKLDLRRDPKYNTWLQYVQSGDENEVYLNFDRVKTESGEKAEAGFFFSEDNDIYFTFVSEKKSIEDEKFYSPSGYLFYNQEDSVFSIENKKKASGENLSGKILTYDEEKQEVKFEGPVSFFKGNKELTLTASVIGEVNLEKKEFLLNSLILAQMTLPSRAFYLMSTDLKKEVSNESIPEGLGDPTDLLYKIADIVGEKEVKNFEQRSLHNYVSLTSLPALTKSIAFANVNMRWSKEHKAFYSTEFLGISHILNFDINAELEGFMEIKKNEDGSPVFNVFMKASPESWYYFSFEDNILLVFSSNDEFNSVIESKTKISHAGGFAIASEEEALDYVNHFRKIYMDIESPYNLQSQLRNIGNREYNLDDEEDGF